MVCVSLNQFLKFETLKALREKLLFSLKVIQSVGVYDRASLMKGIT